MSEAKVTLTREGVEKLAEHFYDGGRLSDWQQIELLHIAISALSQEAVREEVLEEVAQMAQDRAASEHDDFSEFAHDVRALKREPNAAAQAGQGFSSAPSHEGHAAGPAPAAPDVASMVKQAEQNAQYWLKAGYEEPHRDLAVLNVEQAMNAYKNAMYALLARLGQGWIPVSDEMVNRFLNWPLPDSVCSDECATKRDWGKAQGWPKRVGTNLLTADEARQMLDYVLKGEAK